MDHSNIERRASGGYGRRSDSSAAARGALTFARRLRGVYGLEPDATDAEVLLEALRVQSVAHGVTPGQLELTATFVSAETREAQSAVRALQLRRHEQRAADVQVHGRRRRQLSTAARGRGQTRRPR
ncbi:MAG: hypothetical protein ACR2LK_14015 [Solirubrobacteraceae bacterium]